MTPVKSRLGSYVLPCLLSLAAQGRSQPACPDLSLTSPHPKVPGPRNSWVGSAQLRRAPHSKPHSLGAEVTWQVTGLCPAQFPYIHPKERHQMDFSQGPAPTQCQTYSKSSSMIICQGTSFVLSSARIAWGGKQGGRAGSCSWQGWWHCETCVT